MIFQPTTFTDSVNAEYTVTTSTYEPCKHTKGFWGYIDGLFTTRKYFACEECQEILTEENYLRDIQFFAKEVKG